MADYEVQFMYGNIALSSCAENLSDFCNWKQLNLSRRTQYFLVPPPALDNRYTAQYSVSIVLNVQWVSVRGLVILRFYCCFLQTFMTNAGPQPLPSTSFRTHYSLLSCYLTPHQKSE